MKKNLVTALLLSMAMSTAAVPVMASEPTEAVEQAEDQTDSGDEEVMEEDEAETDINENADADDSDNPDADMTDDSDNPDADMDADGTDDAATGASAEEDSDEQDADEEEYTISMYLGRAAGAVLGTVKDPESGEALDSGYEAEKTGKASQTVREVFGEIQDATADGHAFVGWDFNGDIYTSEELNNMTMKQVFDNMYGSVEVYAVFENDSHDSAGDVILHGNGGTFNFTDEIFGESDTWRDFVTMVAYTGYPVNTFYSVSFSSTPSGKVFEGWKLAHDDSGKLYTTDEIMNMTINDESTMEYWAQWKDKASESTEKSDTASKTDSSSKTGTTSKTDSSSKTGTTSKSDSSSKSTTSSGTMYSITASALNVRKGPSTSYGILGTLKKGAKVSVLSTSGNWGKISYNGKTGWIYMAYAEKVSSTAKSTSGTAYVVTASALNVRKGASTSYSVLGSLPKGTKVTILGTSGNWGKISYKGQTGWVYMKYVSKVSGSSSSASTTTKTVRVNTSLNVRSGAGTKYSVIGSLYNGNKVTVLGTSGNWSKISYNGKTAWVYSAYLK